MKKILMSTAIAAMFLATSCQNEDVISSQSTGNVTVHASTMVESRTYVQGQTVYWSEGDKLFAFGGQVSGTLTLQGKGGSTNGKFSGFVSGNPDNLKGIVYPAEMVQYQNGKVTINIGEIDAENSNAPMFAGFGSNINFTHLAAMVRMQINDVPATGNDLTISGTGIGQITIDAEGNITYSQSPETITVTGLKQGTNEICFPVFTQNVNAAAEVPLQLTIGDGTSISVNIPLKAEALSVNNVPILTYNEGTKQLTNETTLPEGNEQTGDYVISTVTELIQFANLVNNGKDNFSGKTITLGADIDLQNQEWTPIGTSSNNFKGTFDGQGHTIKNLNIIETEAREGKAYIGLFGYANNATIKNVTFENVNLNIACLDIDHSQGHIGAVAGSLEGTSTIENVTVKGDIKVEATFDANGASRVAVVAGGNSYGNVTMKNVHVIANERSYLKANNNVGALAGQLQGKNVFENCSSNIDVTGKKFFAGGIIGIAAGDSQFTECHTTGDVTITAGREGRANDHYRVGGIAGGWADGATKVCTLTNCSYTGKVSGTNADGSVANPLDYAGYVGRGYTLAKCAGSKVVLDGVEYVQAYDSAYGNYIVGGVLTLSTADGLKNFANEVNVNKNAFSGKTVKLVANIDLANEAWTPIGQTGATTFNGVFDGQDFTISNLNVNSENQTGAHYSSGLFGWVESHTAGHGHLKNVKINGATIVGHHNCGALVGYITEKYAIVENCHVAYATISCTYANGDAAGDKAGALIGNATVATTVKNCTASNSTVSAGRDSGQVIGAGKEANVTGCSATKVTVTANGTGTGANVRNEVIGRLL